MVFKRGFSLLELIVVLTIIGILSSIGQASYREYVAKVRKDKLQVTMGIIHDAFQVAGSLSGDEGNFCWHNIGDVNGDGTDDIAYHDFFELEIVKNLTDGFFDSYDNYKSNIANSATLLSHTIKPPIAIGFDNSANPCFGALTDRENETGIGLQYRYSVESNWDGRLASCTLNEASYRVGAFGFFKSNEWIGMSMNHRGFFNVRSDINDPSIVTSPCS